MKRIRNVTYEKRNPDDKLLDYVECFWSVRNESDKTEEFSIMPDGFFDIIITRTDGLPVKSFLYGLYTENFKCVVPGKTLIIAVSLKLPSLGSIIKREISDIVNGNIELLPDYFGIDFGSIKDLDVFTNVLNKKFIASIKDEGDSRKIKLCRRIYASAGNLKIASTSMEIGWSARGINRFFNRNVGLSLKKYLKIIMFHDSFRSLKAKELNRPDLYYDQPHYIRETRKFSKTTPKKLSKNENDRFIQLSVTGDEYTKDDEGNG